MMTAKSPAEGNQQMLFPLPFFVQSPPSRMAWELYFGKINLTVDSFIPLLTQPFEALVLLGTMGTYCPEERCAQ